MDMLGFFRRLRGRPERCARLAAATSNPAVDASQRAGYLHLWLLLCFCTANVHVGLSLSFSRGTVFCIVDSLGWRRAFCYLLPVLPHAGSRCRPPHSVHAAVPLRHSRGLLIGS